MDKVNPAQERFAELIWRTVKLRVSLLFVCAVTLLITWSGLTNGNIEATKLDVDFCNQLQIEAAKSMSELAGKPVEPFMICTADHARYFIESGRAFEAVLPLEGAAFDKSRAERADYDQKRRAAYKLEIGLSSQGAESKVIVNTLSVAEVVPFVVVLILAIVKVLGFQQNAYREYLRSLLNEMKSKGELDHGIAGSQFLSGLDINKTGKFGAWMVFSPEGAAIWVLVAGVSYLLLAVLGAFVINIIHLTNSIFLNYLCALYTLMFVLAVFLWRTGLTYQHHSEQARRQTSNLFITVRRWLYSRWCVGNFLHISSVDNPGRVNWSAQRL
jgi:hypothetical protein